VTHLSFRSWLAPAALALFLLTLLLAGVPASRAVAAPFPPPLREEAKATQLRQCRSIARARCGSIKVLLDRQKPSVGKLKIGFELYG